MRYFKYEKKKMLSEDLKERIKELNTQEKKAYRKSKALHHIATVVFFCVFIVVCIGSFYFISFIPESENTILRIIDAILSGVLVLLVIICSAVIAAVTALPLWNIQDKNSRIIRQRIRSAATADLKEFYGLCEPMLVTKCYGCSDGSFKDHDVCLFFVDRELRVTTNLKYGFYDLKKDLGCYAFTKEEISLSSVKAEAYDAAEITAGDFRMLLGKRALGFIERNSD